MHYEMSLLVFLELGRLTTPRNNQSRCPNGDLETGPGIRGNAEFTGSRSALIRAIRGHVHVPNKALEQQLWRSKLRSSIDFLLIPSKDSPVTQDRRRLGKFSEPVAKFKE